MQKPKATGLTRGPTVLIDDPPPSEEAQIDSDEVGYVATAEGRRRKLWMLIVTLPMRMLAAQQATAASGLRAKDLVA